MQENKDEGEEIEDLVFSEKEVEDMQKILSRQEATRVKTVWVGYRC